MEMEQTTVQWIVRLVTTYLSPFNFLSNLRVLNPEYFNGIQEFFTRRRASIEEHPTPVSTPRQNPIIKKGKFLNSRINLSKPPYNSLSPEHLRIVNTMIVNKNATTNLQLINALRDIIQKLLLKIRTQTKKQEKEKWTLMKQNYNTVYRVLNDYQGQKQQ